MSAKLGRPLKWTPEAIQTMLQMKEKGKTYQEIGEYFDSDAGCVRNVLYRVRK